MAAYLGISRSALSMAEQFRRNLNPKAVQRLRIFEESIRKADHKTVLEEQRLERATFSARGLFEEGFVEGLA